MVGEERGGTNWIFRNQRWHFVPAQGARLVPGPGELHGDQVAALVDLSSLVAPLQAALPLIRLPICLFSCGPCRPPAGAGEPAGKEQTLLKPAWWSDLEKLHPALSSRLQADFLAVAREALTAGETSWGASFFGPATVAAEPVRVSQGERRLSCGLVALLTASVEELPDPSALSERLKIPLPRARRMLALMARHLPRRLVVADHFNLVRTLVATRSTQLQQALDDKLELVAEQARSRHLLVRAEQLEKQLLRSGAEVDRAREAAGTPVRELEALLDSPYIGVTIEDADYRVRYQNGMLRQAFGDQRGRLCFEVFKARKSPCELCPIELIWEEGRDSVRYTTRDPRTGRTFEVFSAPLVGQKGERMIIEVGVEVTQLVQEQEALVNHNRQVQDRLEQQEEMVRQLNSLLLTTAGEVGDLMIRESILRPAADRDPSIPHEEMADGRAHLLEVVKRAGQVAMALATREAPQPTEVPLLALAAARQAAADLGVGVPAVCCAVMPRVNGDSASLNTLLVALVRYLCRKGRQQEAGLRLSHTMSGDRDRLSKGDRFHLLSLADGEQRLWEPDGSVPHSEMMTEVSGITENVDDEDDTDLIIAALVTRRLGGLIWLQRRSSGALSFYFTMPA